MTTLHNKIFGILGLGISNKAVLEFFINHNHKFIIWDDTQKSLTALAIEIKKDYNFDIVPFIKTPESLEWSNIDYLVMSPGIPLTHPEPHKIASIARQNGIDIICDIELFYLFYPNNKYIGITGTNGKSTITALTYHILNSYTHNTLIAGNIGKPIFYLEDPEDKIIVLEISSYQIDLLHKTRFFVSSLSNVTPDHIDRHGSFENYTKIKFKLISELTTGTAVINIDSDLTETLYRKLIKTKHHTIPTSTNIILEKGISLINNTITDNIHHQTLDLATNKSLVGQHNAQNIGIAFAIASSVIPITPEDLNKSIASFQGLKHRMQFINHYKNMVFINDSKGTNAISTLYALDGCKNIFWILGGLPKADGIDPLIPFFKNVKHAFAIGQAKEEFAKILKIHNVPCTISGDLKHAFKDATDQAEQQKEEITILLSPACASFDQWKNFEERGDAFIKLVEDFIKTKKDA
ncbi:MAG: UDP-N-acetylmuramoyl-L-alanine--D-glutamate ligase [Rickettsiales bacterium]|nr:UDP-N-acetylmuramoyl-L-alanine--D-glutamate ligase [Rickettsiales bacterium]